MTMFAKMKKAMDNFYAQSDFAYGASNFVRVPDYLR